MGILAGFLRCPSDPLATRAPYQESGETRFVLAYPGSNYFPTVASGMRTVFVIVYQPWEEAAPYGVYLGADIVPSPLLERFESEEEARDWCELRCGGRQIAEYPLPHRLA